MTDLVPDGDGPLEATDATERMLARLRDEVNIVRRANEVLARERLEVEQALGRQIHAGELAAAVKMALYRETGIH